MIQATVKAGQEFGEIAAEHLGNSSRFRELIESNGLDPEAIFETALDTFGSEVAIDVPEPQDLIEPARPVLSRARQITTQTQQVLTQVSAVLPPELQGYTAEALSLIGEVNGAIDGVANSDILSVVSDLTGLDIGRGRLGNSTYRIVDWLLQRSQGSPISSENLTNIQKGTK